MLKRTIFSSLLLVSLVGLAVPACDGDDDGDDDGQGDDGNDDGDDGNDDGDDGNDDGNADDGDDGNDDGDDGNADDGNADDGDDGNADDGNADDGGGGGVGDQCQGDADCDSNACIFAGDVDYGICTILCDSFADCPSFWSCEEIGNATGTYCVPD